MRRSLVPVVVAALVATAVPQLPAAGEHVGFTCGTVTTGDAREQAGFLFGGPVVVTVDGRPAQAVFTCSLQVDGPDPQLPDVATVQAGGVGLVTVPPSGVSAQVQPGSPVYVCTEVYVVGFTVVHYDNDPAMPGNQCRGTTWIDTTGRTHVDPMTVWGRYCHTVTVNGNPTTVCVP